jgi:proline iminopeptidase
VLGRSWGAVLALEYALRYPARVSRLVLLNPAPASSADYATLRAEHAKALGPDFARMRDLMASAAYKEGNPDTVAARYRIHFETAFARPDKYEALMERMRAAFVSQGVPGILEARAVEGRVLADSWASDTFDLLAQASAIRRPTLVAASGRDFIPMAIAEHIARSIPQAKLVVFKDCGHFSYMECPEDVRRALYGFLVGDRARRAKPD